MKKFSLLATLAFVAMGVAFTSCDSKKSAGSVKLTSDIDSASYILGKANIYGFIKQQKQQMESWPDKGNYDAFIAGIYDVLENPEDSLFLGKEMADASEFLNAFFARLGQKLSDIQKAEGEKFFAENRGKSDVVTTESGLQYKIITEGTGAKPKMEDIIRIHYVGKYLDDVEFDSTLNREPAELQLSLTSIPIQGWLEAFQLMPVGSKYIIWVPASLAFGEQGNQLIRPNATLVFEVDMLDIVK